jgi:hypothetical protein
MIGFGQPTADATTHHSPHNASSGTHVVVVVVAGLRRSDGVVGTSVTVVVVVVVVTVVVLVVAGWYTVTGDTICSSNSTSVGPTQMPTNAAPARIVGTMTRIMNTP